MQRKLQGCLAKELDQRPLAAGCSCCPVVEARAGLLAQALGLAQALACLAEASVAQAWSYEVSCQLAVKW